MATTWIGVEHGYNAMDRCGTRIRHRGWDDTGGLRGEEAAKRTAWAQSTLVLTIGLISNLVRFYSRYYHKRMVLLLGLRHLTGLPSACPSAPSGETDNTHILRRRRGQLPAEHMACPHAAHLLVV